VSVRRLPESRLEEAVELSDMIFRSKGGSMRKDFPLLFSKSNLQNILYIEKDGKIVSMLGLLFRKIQFFSARVQAVLVGSVCTHPSYRGRGYSTELIKEAEKISLERKAPLMMISGDNSIYRKFGAVDAGIYFTHKVESNFFSKVKYVKYKKVSSTADRDFIILLHSRENVRFVRKPEDFQKMIELSRAVDRPARIFVSEAAYAVMVRDEHGINNCVESAGNPIAIADLVRSIANEDGMVLMHTTLANCALNSLLSNENTKRRRFMGTVKVLNKKMLIEQLTPYLEESLTDSGTERLNNFMNMDLSDFTRSIFGSKESDENLSNISAFPIPLPDYGMDYV